MGQHFLIVSPLLQAGELGPELQQQDHGKHTDSHAEACVTFKLRAVVTHESLAGMETASAGWSIWDFLGGGPGSEFPLSCPLCQRPGMVLSHLRPQRPGVSRLWASPANLVPPPQGNTQEQVPGEAQMLQSLL